MVSTVRSRPNHYEVLGLTPTASDAEILQAFAREMSMFRARPMAAVAQISVAYETLRNPAKRRAYDASLRLGTEPEPSPPPAEAPPKGSPFIGSSPRARTEGLPERRLGSFIAESLRDPVGVDEPAPEPVPQPEPEATAKPGVEAHLADLLAARHVRQDDARGRPIEWKRPALAAGGLVLAVGLAGAVLGWRGGDAGTPPQAEPDMAIALPEATPALAAVSPPPAQAEAQPEQPATVAETPRTEEHARTPLQIAAVDEPQAEVAQTVETPAAEAATEPAAAAVPAATGVATALPLPNATIARTIGRIGYACGQVASTEAVAGEAPGVFKVTCTSGQSYRAAPVRGRYHFRRWDRQ